MARFLKALAALIALAAVVVAIPAGLWLAAGSPIPTSLPTLSGIGDALTSPDDGTLLLGIFKVVGWLAWASFVVTIPVEIAAALRGVTAPQLPGLGLQQRGAAVLVAPIIALFIAAPVTAGVATAAPADATPHHATTSQIVDAGVDQTQTAATEPQQVDTRTHVVEPGESLYGIAEKLLGDGDRWKEIADLNYDKPQTDGGALTDAHWIEPGWELQVPVIDHIVVQPGDSLSSLAQTHLGDPEKWTDLFEANKDQPQPGGGMLTDPHLIEPGWRLTLPGHAPDTTSTEQQPATETPATEQPPAQQPPAAQEQPAAETPADTPATDTAASMDQVAPDVDEGGFSVRTVAGVGGLLAAGLLGLIAARRRAQQRRRKPGHAVPMPTGHALETELELRTVGDPISVELVDQALRMLAYQCAESAQSLPRVRAARLTADQFDLYLAEPTRLPAPWNGTEDQAVWTLNATAEDYLNAADVDLTEVPSPYPALVTLGHDEDDGHVLLDLEYLGALGITGDPEQTRQVMAALAVELATSQWADDLQITLVGAYPELEDALETGRVRYLPAVGRLVDQLTHRADGDREALTESGAGDLNQARVTGQVPGAWTPEIVIIPGQITDRQREELSQLVEELPRVAIAAVTGGESVGEWALRITGPQSGVLEPFGLEVQPQLLDDETYGQILQVLAVTDTDDTTPHQEWEAHTEPTLDDVEALLAEDTPVADSRDAAGDDDQAVGEEQHDQHHEHQGDEQQEQQAEREPDLRAVPDVPDHEHVDDDRLDEQVDDDRDDHGDAEAEEEVREVGVATGDVPAEAAAADDHPGDGEGQPTPAASQPEEHAVAVPDAPGPAPAAPEPDVAEAIALPSSAATGPRILMLGEVTVEAVDNALVEPTRRRRLTELATILATHPGCDHTTIDACYYPGQRVKDNTRNTQMSKLRRWFGKTPAGDDYLPRYEPGTQYRFHDEVTSDWDDWQQLLPEGAAGAPTSHLQTALSLVRGRPFDAVPARRYAWAEELRQQMIAAIVDASYELTRRQIMEGKWLAAETTALVGLLVEPGTEALWRMRITALHARGNTAGLERAIQQLLDLAEEWGGELEPETETVLEQLDSDTPARGTVAAAGLR